MKTGLVCLLAAALAGCAHGPWRGLPEERVTVEAEGWAATVTADPLGTARRALAEAQRKAVEKVTGVSVRARTTVAQAVAVEQKIRADVSGRILGYEILGEREEGGFHKTRIRAVVLKTPSPPGAAGPELFPDDLRVAVELSARSDPDQAAAERGLRRAFREAGLAVASGRADFVVSGQAEAVALDGAGLEGLASYRARLAVELRDPVKDELLAAASFEASAVDPSGRLAAAKALEQAGQLAGRKLAEDLRAVLAER